MTVHEFLQYFFALDLQQMAIRVNYDAKSIWLAQKDNADTKIHIRLTDDYAIMRLYIHTTDYDYKASVLEREDTITYHYLSTDKNKLQENVINNVLTIKTEEEFFQFSLLNDTLDLTFNDCQEIKVLFVKMVALAHEKFKDAQ